MTFLPRENALIIALVKRSGNEAKTVERFLIDNSKCISEKQRIEIDKLTSIKGVKTCIFASLYTLFYKITWVENGGNTC